MIFAALIGVGLQGEPMKWTGKVKAFAYYLDANCNPSERMHVVYVVRKCFEDGSTVTVVRSVPVGTHPTMHPMTSGEGTIERDPSGAATKITTRVVFALGGSTVESAYELDPKKGVLTGWGTYGTNNLVSKGLTLAAPREYLLDPLEGIAFGSPQDSSAGWLLPAATYGYVNPRAPSVGLRLVFGRPLPYAFDLNGRREMFRRLVLERRWIGSSIANASEPAGSLLFHMDGTFAAYVPLIGVERLPGTSFAYGGYSSQRRPVGPPPFELKGELAKAWDEAPQNSYRDPSALNPLCGIFVPRTVSAAEKSLLLSGIPDREKPVEKEKPIDKGDGSGPPR